MYLMTAKVTIGFAPDGADALTVPSAQSFEASYDIQGNAAQGFQLVPGGNSPTAGNINTAVVAIAAAISTYLQTAPVLAQIQGWSSGGD